MFKTLVPKTLAAISLASMVVALLVNTETSPSQASSHREAPLIAYDPAADNTDVYAFRSTEAGREGFVTLIANYLPDQSPSGGPHFYKFDDTVLYEIKIDNTGDGVEDVSYQFQFTTEFKNGDTVLGMAAPTTVLQGTGKLDGLIATPNDPDYNEPQTYTVTRMNHATGSAGKALASGLITPPNNIGERTTPSYEILAQQTVYKLPGDGRVFAGQRDEGFYIDVAGVFDTLNLRSIVAKGSKDSLAGKNVSSIAIEVPIQDLTRGGKMAASPTDADAVIGIWATASRRTMSVLRDQGSRGNGSRESGNDFRQVSRLGNPLVNEVVIPLKLKDAFNASSPKDDAIAAPFVLDPQLPKLLQAVFKIDIPPAPRNDLVAIFATGIKAGSVPGAPTFNTFLSDGTPHDMLRLNVAIPPTPKDKQKRMGLLENDPAGYPNGRRVGDDVTDIALRAMAGGTPFTPATNKKPNNLLGDGIDKNDVEYLDRFPYLGTPHSGNPK
ncbi:MAG: DUF4331 domain-containing protein [Pyrinomonadaceae bacterium]|nr:DUF4331 domain-containing protein [Pyrinomonadaceae bacterium]